ncbi:MAG TPA: YraN family protein [Dongiaceae bacterium]|nr:YraN family protein [Dongiaceae bacterium]
MSAGENARSPRRGSKDRQKAWQGGRWAESLAALRLRCSGYTILARNWRSPVGEIDIIARRGRVLAIIEVKRRAERTTALAAISPRQQARLVRAALAFQASHADCAALNLRFDVVTLGSGPLGGGLGAGLWPHHLKDAWRPGAE